MKLPAYKLISVEVVNKGKTLEVYDKKQVFPSTELYNQFINELKKSLTKKYYPRLLTFYITNAKKECFTQKERYVRSRRLQLYRQVNHKTMSLPLQSEAISQTQRAEYDKALPATTGPSFKAFSFEKI